MPRLGKYVALGCAIALTATYACSSGGSQTVIAPKQATQRHPWVWPFEAVEAPDQEDVSGPVDDVLAPPVCDPHFRWAIKTLADANAPQVNFTPVSTTIAALRAVAHPTPWPLPFEYPTRIKPYEYTTWQLKNVLLAEIYPPAKDQDYHLILQDGSGNQMIAEVPLLTCAPGTIAGSLFSPIYSYISKTWDFGSPPTPVFPNVVVSVTGVGFFDPYEGDHPVSGAELHPVLSFVLGSGSPSPSPTPTAKASPTPTPTPKPSPTPSPTPTPSPSPTWQREHATV